MMNLGGPEMLLLAILALVMFGPKRLPELGKALGEGLSAFRESSRQLRQDFTRQLEEETREPEPPRAVPADVLLPPVGVAAAAAQEVTASETEPIELQVEDAEEEDDAAEVDDEPRRDAIPAPTHAAPMARPRPAPAVEEAPAQA